jgi:hypothetical protein
MGGSNWSDTAYADRALNRAKTNAPVFAYSSAVKSGQVAAKVHKSLDPHGLKVRESRDSDIHPESNAIIIALDVTGSMGKVVGEIHAKLPSLMNLLTQKGYIKDPAILMTAVGDATCDKFPLQVGQFESGIEIENDITNVIIEGAGGGQNTESYELVAYVGARKTSIDCVEKRNKKGYFFFIGDELPYPQVSADEVNSLIGEKQNADIPTEVIFKELKEKYNVFFILPEDASGGHSPQVISRWGDLVGQEHVLKLPKASAVAELIATQVGLCEGTTTLKAAVADMKDHGASAADIELVKSHVAKGSANINVPAAISGALKESTTDSKVERI